MKQTITANAINTNEWTVEIMEAEAIGIQVSHDGKVWVCVDDQCVLRAHKTKKLIEMTGPKGKKITVNLENLFNKS